jgi:hypothetical protein
VIKTDLPARSGTLLDVAHCYTVYCICLMSLLLTLQLSGDAPQVQAALGL